jgi:ribonuclease P protein component
MFPYTSPSAGGVAGLPSAKESEDDQGKAHVPAEHAPPCEDARLPFADADPCRPVDPRRSPTQGPQPPQRLRLTATVRTREIQRVFHDAEPVHGKRVVLFVAPGSGEFALVAGKKIGGAVQRNRARRVLRAAIREVAPRGVEGHDVVLVAREGIRDARTQDLITEMTELLQRGGMGR